LIPQHRAVLTTGIFLHSYDARQNNWLARTDPRNFFLYQDWLGHSIPPSDFGSKGWFSVTNFTCGRECSTMILDGNFHPDQKEQP